MANWSFLTNHGRALVCIARNPEVRLAEIASDLSISERRAHAIVSELRATGYLVIRKAGRRNRYEIQGQLPLPEFMGRDQGIGAVLGLLAAPGERRRFSRRAGDKAIPA
jgi:hypothetical protein